MAGNSRAYNQKYEELMQQGNISQKEAHKQASEYAERIAEGFRTGQQGKEKSMSPSTKEYQDYVKKIEKKGAKGTGIPNEAEYHQVQGRLRDNERLRRAMAKSIVKNGKSAYPLADYAKETGNPSFQGAAGDDLEELNKRFKRK
jgi:hypothetical protein